MRRNLLAAITGVLAAVGLTMVFAPNDGVTTLDAAEATGIRATAMNMICGATAHPCQDWLYSNDCHYCVGTNSVKKCKASPGDECIETGPACGEKMECTPVQVHSGTCVWVTQCRWNTCSANGQCPDKDCG